MKVKQIFAVGGMLAISYLPLNARVGFGIVVGTPPPPPLVVAGPVGQPPGPGYIWVDGYWDWFDGRWVWTPGRWVLPPHPRAVWVVPAFHPYHGHYHFYRGHWR